MTRGYVVYREEEDGPNRIPWARRGDNQVVRVFATRDGERVVVRGLTAVRQREHGRGWVRRAHAEAVITEIDGRMRRAH